MRWIHRLTTHALNAALIIGLFGCYGAVRAAQGSVCMPTTGTISGLTFAQAVNAGFAALISSNSGSGAPANDCSAAAVKGQVWLDTSSAPNPFKMHDGTSFVTMGMLDTTGHAWNPRAGDGTLAAPGIAFQSEPASGVRRAGANDLRIVVNGVDILQINAAGATLMAGTFNSVPVGTVVDYTGATEPAGWLWMYGQCISNATYPALTTLWGTTYGTGCAGGQTRAPDTRGRVTASPDTISTAANRLTNAATGCGVAAVLGAVCGGQSHTLTSAQIPAHTHSGTTNNGGTHAHGALTQNQSVGHTHNYLLASANNTTINVGSGANGTASVTTSISNASTASGTDIGNHTHPITVESDHTHGFTTDNGTGGGGAHPIVQPTIVFNKIVKY